MNMMNRGKYSGDFDGGHAMSRRLGDNWALVTPVDLEVEREKHGYEILKDENITCADCGKKLLDIIKVKENEQLQKVISAKCPCGGESFLYVVTGETFMQASEGRTITDMPTEIKEGIMHITVEVI